MKKVLIIFVSLIVILGIALSIAIASFDVNKYRPQITQVLSQQTGRTVKLDGPIKLEVGFDGVSVSIQDASISNPAWASRPEMAGIGKFQLGVAVMPLLQHQLVVTSLKIEAADIQLESASGDRHNWDLHPVSAQSGATEAKMSPIVPTAPAKPAAPGEAVAIDVHDLSITNSQITLRSEDGKVTVFKATVISLGKASGGMLLHFVGDYNGLPISLDIKTNAEELTSMEPRPIDADLTFANYHIKATGKASLGNKTALFDAYQLSSGNSTILGKMALEWGGAHPSVVGSINSEHLAPADFKMASGADGASKPTPTNAPATPKTRMLSDAPLGLEALKSVDAILDIAIGELPLGTVALKNIDTKLTISGGKMLLSPLKSSLGAGTIDGQINLDGTTSPPHLGMTINAKGVNLSDLLGADSLQAFLTGKVDTDMNIVANGESLHGLASTLSGSFNLVGSSGTVVGGASDGLASALQGLLSGGTGGNSSLNCLVARFTAANGLMKDNGILFDTSAATVAGSGGIDLRGEVIDLTFKGKPKLIDTGGFLPPMYVDGTFLQPHFGVSAESVVANVAGLLIGQMPSDTVPNVTATPAGQNACLAAITRPATSAGVTTPSAVGAAGAAVQEITGKAGSMLKGLFGQ